MQPTIASSRSLIMHASLAHLSTELRTFDSILRDSSQSSTRGRLPPELLLIIREHLFPIITNQLYQRSVTALAQYESSLRRLLCDECLGFHQDVYGLDIWKWEHFFGPCLCSASNTRSSGETEDPEYWDTLYPKLQFDNCVAWLEYYLSFEASRLSYRQKTFSSIWDVVNTVLDEYDCEISGALIPATARFVKQDTISIAPAITARAHTADPNEQVSATILHRLSRDLSLSHAYENGLELKGKKVHPRALSHPPKPQPPATLLSRSVHGLETIVDLTISCITFPLTFTTAILTVLCYCLHPRPHPLRPI
jgi:hypothetical protein